MSQGNILAIRLTAARKENNYTQEEIAGFLNCGRATITNYENGRRSPDYDTLIKLAKKYNVTTDYLLGLTDVETTDKDIRYICDYTGLSEEALSVIKTSFDHITPICQVINTLSITTESRNILYSTFAQVETYKKSCIEATNRIKEITPTNYESCSIALNKKDLERYKAENNFRDLLNYFAKDEEEYIKQNRSNYDCIAIDIKLEKTF